jgi:hypothetical protein
VGLGLGLGLGIIGWLAVSYSEAGHGCRRDRPEETVVVVAAGVDVVVVVEVAMIRVVVLHVVVAPFVAGVVDVVDAVAFFVDSPGSHPKRSSKALRNDAARSSSARHLSKPSPSGSGSSTRARSVVIALDSGRSNRGVWP